MDDLGQQIAEQLIAENTPIIGLYPGGFKPPHKGHFEVVKRAAENVDEIHVIISNNIREGYTPELSLKIWKQYQKLLPENVMVSISKENSPITEIYDIVKNIDNNSLAIYGKGEQDRYNSVNENREKYHNVDVIDAGTIEDISATSLREAIAKRDFPKIKSLIPEGIKVNDFLMNFQIHEEKIPGGLAKGKSLYDLVIHHGKDSWASIQFESLESQLKKQLEKGIKVEMEHTTSKDIAKEIAMDHLWEDPKYYDKLATIEEDLDESKNLGTLYHFTSLFGIHDILTSNFLKGSNSETEEFSRDFQFLSPEQRQKVKEKGSVFWNYISLTRDKNLYKKNPSLRGSTVRIVLDGNKISSNYKIKPFSYYGNEQDGDENYRFSSNESEERINLGDKEGINNLDKYIEGIDIFLDKIEDNKMYLKQIENIKLQFPQINILYKDKPITIEQYRKDILPGLMDQDMALNESKILKEVFNKNHGLLLDKAVNYVCEDLDIPKPEIILINNPEYTQQHKSFGGYTPSDKKIYAVVHNRNVADIMRSISHELFHLKQDLDGRLTSEAGEDGDAFENEANSYAGKIMREIGRNIPEIFE